jgi:hypothetical protein
LHSRRPTFFLPFRAEHLVQGPGYLGNYYSKREVELEDGNMASEKGLLWDDREDGLLG